MMFGSDNFPLGPNGKFPFNRQRDYGRMLIPPVNIQDVYLSGGSNVSKLPNLERDFNSSNKRVKMGMNSGSPIRSGYKGINRFYPRYAPYFGQKGIRSEVGVGSEDDFEPMMDTDPKYDSNGSLHDEGETDDNVGYYRRQTTSGRFLPFTGLLKKSVSRR